jgi:hypothetical protein
MLEAAFRTINGCHEFIIRTDEPDYLETLIQLGYGPLSSDPDEHVRRFPEFDDVDATFQRFSAHLRPWLDQMSRRTPTPWEDALATICCRAADADLDWFLLGSTSLAVRGIPVHPRDVDIAIPDQARALEVFGDLLVGPPLFHKDTTFVSYWSGRAFAEARIEWISFIHPTLDSWMWPNEVGEYAQRHLETVPWRDWTLRVPPLAVQLEITEQREMPERAALIRAHLE